MTRRLAPLLVLLVVTIGAAVVPKLYWQDRPVTMTCADMEHAMVYLADLKTAARASAGTVCMPGEPRCLAEGWMYYEANDLHTFLAEMYRVSCQDV